MTLKKLNLIKENQTGINKSKDNIIQNKHNNDAY